jgi:hypothetical protein
VLFLIPIRLPNFILGFRRSFQSGPDNTLTVASNSPRPRWFRFYSSVTFDRYFPLMYHESDGSYNRRKRPSSLPQEMNSGMCSVCWSILHVGITGAQHSLTGSHEDDDEPNGSTTPGNSLHISCINIFYRNLYTALLLWMSTANILYASVGRLHEGFGTSTPCFIGIFSDKAVWLIVDT